MKKVYKVTTGYEHKDGYDHNISATIVIADDAEEAIAKMKKEDPLTDGGAIESVSLVCVIDIE